MEAQFLQKPITGQRRARGIIKVGGIDELLDLVLEGENEILSDAITVMLFAVLSRGALDINLKLLGGRGNQC
jgi:hypothetical protein